jgi:hypothetical protein
MLGEIDMNKMASIGNMNAVNVKQDFILIFGFSN